MWLHYRLNDRATFLWFINRFLPDLEASELDWIRKLSQSDRLLYPSQ
jgi:hypothetical protein